MVYALWIAAPLFLLFKCTSNDLINFRAEMISRFMKTKEQLDIRLPRQMTQKSNCNNCWTYECHSVDFQKLFYYLSLETRRYFLFWLYCFSVAMQPNVIEHMDILFQSNSACKSKYLFDDWWIQSLFCVSCCSQIFIHIL